ncbi:hypothetical protein A8L34_14725 [Bacillus sp. FJAT-27264]|uniref:hypothetical protein n=1 Tax=Paenibacillus sp. (strain DSM 101736 / FJAT-27264) TaxID=1850362 RepID=UPI000807FAE4|nr:hypothetical protein [Bacillus sp. FJAT-27264]OBZ11603.1 hypothetical protein A8L34_14725 [Bacillus sp. FJAT-27264]
MSVLSVQHVMALFKFDIMVDGSMKKPVSLRLVGTYWLLLFCTSPHMNPQVAYLLQLIQAARIIMNTQMTRSERGEDHR